MQLKKIKDILKGNQFKLYQVNKVWNVVVQGELSGTHILELEGCKGFIGRKVIAEGIHFQYLT